MNDFLVIDLEATCWRDKTEGNSEIIEIGLAVVKDRKIIWNEGIIVKPENSTVSPFCTQLTSLTQADVDKGISLKEACHKLETVYNSKSLPWVSYGMYDFNKLTYECRDKKIDYPMHGTHINIKSKAINKFNLVDRKGLSEACYTAGIRFEGRHHRGVDDAYNIAKLALTLI